MAGFLFLFLFFVAGGVFGPVQYHPNTPLERYQGAHESGLDK